MALASFIGNEHVITMVQRIMEKKALPHAWLFMGPNQVGKRTFAMEWAKLLNCASPYRTPKGIDACDLCPSCRQIRPERPSYAQTHPTVQVIDTLMAAYREAVEKGEEKIPPLKPKLSIGVSVIRWVREIAATFPPGRWRVFIIDEAERLTEEASAALLKTLEEPPPKTLFILISTDPWALHPTIRSRCQPLVFRLVPARRIVEALRERGAGEQEATRIARLARGRVGWALKALYDGSWRQDDRRFLSLLRVATEMTSWDIFRFAEEGMAEEDEKSTAQQRRDLGEFLEGLALGFRDLLAVKEGAEDLVINTDWLSELRSAPWTAEAVKEALRQIRVTLHQIRPPLNANPRLALEVLGLHLMRLRKG